MVASADKSEVGDILHNDKTTVPLCITLNEISFPLPPNPIKTDNSAVEGTLTANVRQKRSKAMDTRFYWMKYRLKQKYLFVYWKPGSQNMGQ